MDFPWIPLFFNLLLLGVVLFACRTANAANKTLNWNGALIYFVFCLLAMVLDFTLTMVFASASFHAHTQYESVGSRGAWSTRVACYLVPCAVSLVLALRFRQRQRVAKPRAAAVDVPISDGSTAAAS
ncbi:hypothetical protein P9239_12610 [Caballeronia sp. LZ062]|uniref:hypothetical protein n=1 Tax=unclassified Caballeronia TaxID=2646786 RepID=UPI002867A2DF|nr:MULTISPECIES: hypothetical protein [unclassified Caballeronia]MDR5854283.1 hypothetical protein [Caballeronia sp. LZ050]MDR5871186.1 hypothetical protein [Caballeronia sp. LZ062]